MSFFRTAALFALVMLTLVAAVPAAHAQNTVGTITQLQGVANIERNGATTPAKMNELIMLHDKIMTGPNSSLTIGLVDKSFMQLTASSTLTIDESVLVNGVGAPTKVGLLAGDLHSVILGAMRSSSFEVHTPNAVGAVRGTDFWVHFDTNPGK
ncbi:MAG: FecR family protein [Candidatus Binatus sp.]